MFGDHLFVERVYSFAAAAVTACLIALIWRRSNGTTPYVVSSFGAQEENDPHERECDWLPMALWIAVPVVSWAVVGNLLETTVAVFTTAAVAAIVESHMAGSVATSIVWCVMSGISIAAAVLTKGPIGLFPLAAPLCLLSGRRRVSGATAQWSTVIAVALVLLSIPTARSSLSQYVHQQVLAAIGGTREVSASSLTIVRALLQGVAAPILLTCGLLAALAGRWVAPTNDHCHRAASFLLLGLAGTLPILASAKQTGHYLVPAVPFLALSAACLLAPTTTHLVERIVANGRTFIVQIISATVLIGTVAVAYSPLAGRDRDRLADLDRLDRVVPRGTIVGICAESNSDWGLHAWFERRFHVSLDASDGGAREWFLKTTAATCPLPECRPASDPTGDLVLLRCPRP